MGLLQGPAGPGVAQLHLVLALKVLQAFGYYGVSITLTSFLSSEFGFDDGTAGWLYGCYGMLISVASLLTGPVIDRLGIRRSVLVGAALITGSRVALAFTESQRVCVGILTTALPIGESMGIPVLSLAVGATSSPKNRKWAYGLFYTAMNVAVLIIGPVIDGLRHNGLRHTGGLSPYRSLILCCAGAGLASAVLALVALKDLVPSTSAEEEEPQDGASSTDGAKDEGDLVARGRSVWDWTPGLKRFLALVCCLVGVRMMFRHLDATFPKYIVRHFGQQAPYGLLYSINPAIVIVLVPLLSSQRDAAGSLETARRDGAVIGPAGRCWKGLVTAFGGLPGVKWVASLETLDSVALGTAISTASVLFVCLVPGIPGAALFVVMLSVGESLWSPQFYKYTYDVAPKDQRGRYFALANVPLFLPKLFAGALSGTLLLQYCNETHCENPAPLWWWILLSIVPFAVILWMARGWIAHGSGPLDAVPGKRGPLAVADQLGTKTVY